MAANDDVAHVGVLADVDPYPGGVGRASHVGVLADVDPYPGGVGEVAHVGVLIDFHPPVPNRERYSLQGAALRRLGSVQGNRFRGRPGRARKITPGDEFE
jgi:hypothetical protein